MKHIRLWSLKWNWPCYHGNIPLLHWYTVLYTHTRASIFLEHGCETSKVHETVNKYTVCGQKVFDIIKNEKHTDYIVQVERREFVPEFVQRLKSLRALIFLYLFFRSICFLLAFFDISFGFSFVCFFFFLHAANRIFGNANWSSCISFEINHLNEYVGYKLAMMGWACPWNIAQNINLRLSFLDKSNL